MNEPKTEKQRGYVLTKEESEYVANGRVREEVMKTFYRKPYYFKKKGEQKL